MSNLTTHLSLYMDEMNRRNFIQLSALSAGVGRLLPGCESEPQQAAAMNETTIDRIGVGLFTIPLLLEQDFAGTIKKLAEIGYKEVEMYGPYDFTAQETKDSWAALTGQLGFSGSGYFGHTSKEARAILDDNGMTSPSMHTDLITLKTNINAVVEAAQILGQQYAGIPAIPEPERPDIDGYKRVADLFNEIGMKMSEGGVKLLYHNHGYGLSEMEGEIPFKVILDRTEPEYVAMEMDMYWMTAGKADPVAYLNDYPGRFKLMHIKDMTEIVHFEGDGSTPMEWMPLFPYMADAGAGVLEMPAILSAAKRSGVDHFYLERDMASDPDTTLQASYDYLSTVTLSV